jgi:mevalonate kinase
LHKDIAEFGASFTESFEAQVAMFPHMVDDSLRTVISSYQSRARGWKLSGAGGGGYLILVANNQENGTMSLKIRRP